jgi:hypothetical protein
VHLIEVPIEKRVGNKKNIWRNKDKKISVKSKLYLYAV